MKTLFLFFTTSLIVHSALFAQNWIWARGATSTYGDAGRSVIVNHNGNIYCTGDYTLNVTLDSVVFPGSGGNRNNFIAEFSQSGQLLKTAQLLADNYHADYLNPGHLNTDNSGNIYVPGSFNGNITVDTIHTGGVQCGFLAKFNPDLHSLFVKGLAGPNDLGDAIMSTTFDNLNNDYITASIRDSVAHLDTFTLYRAKLILAKLDSNGKCLRVKQSTGAGATFINCIYAQNSLHFLGKFDSCIGFDTTSICAQSISKVESFIAKADTSGSVKWFSMISSNDPYASILSFTVDHAGNSYILGVFDTSITFGSQTLYCNSSGHMDMFLAKYDSAGILVWYKQLNPTNRASGIDCHVSTSGNLYVLGTFAGSLVLGSDTVTAQSNTDMFILRYNNSGDLMGYKTLPSAGGNSITEDSAGNAVVTGYIYNGDTYFDSIKLTCTNGNSDFFIAKLSAITGTPSAAPRMLQEDRLEIYANPNRGMFTIIVPKSIAGAGGAQLRIYDNAGAEIKSEMVDISGNKIQVELGTVQKGLYTVTLSSGRQFMGKVVIQ